MAQGDVSTVTVFQPPSLPLVQVTLEDTGQTLTDEFGEVVPVHRVTAVTVNNQTPHRWNVNVYKDGEVVFSGNLAAGFSNVYNIQKNRQFLFHTYSASVARQ